MRFLRLALIVVAVLVVLPLAAAGIFAATFDPNAYKPEIIAAVRRATGRDLALNGPLRIVLALRPTIEANDVTFANAAGGSRPEMARVGRARATIAPFALLRGVTQIDRLTIDHPDILLETDAQGRPNWLFDTPSKPLTPSGEQAKASPHRSLVLRDLRVADGQITMRDGRTGQTIPVAVASLTAKTDGVDAPLSTAADVTLNGVALRFAGHTGPLSALDKGGGQAKAWPVELTLAALGATATVKGTLDDPAAARGYALDVAAAVPDLSALAPLARGVALPPVHDLHVAAKLADSGGAIPRVTGLTVTAARSDLSAYAPGLALATLSVAAPALDKPVHAEAAGSYAGAPFSARADLGAPAALMPKDTQTGGTQTAPFPIDVTARIAGADVAVKGGVGNPAALSGLDVAVDAAIPDLGAFAPLLRRPVPALKSVAVKARLADGPGGFAHETKLTGLHLTMPGTDLGGDLALGWAPRPSLRGTIVAPAIDADAIRAAFAAPARPPATATQPAVPAQPAQAPAPAQSGAKYLIPDTKLPFEALKTFDADLTLSVAALQHGGETWRDLKGHAVVAGGKLTLDPFGADLPAGHLDVKANVDTTQPGPPVALVVHSPGVSAAPLFNGLSGRLEVETDISGRGDTPHAIAATATGQLGLAMVGGKLDNHVLDGTLGAILKAARLPDLAGRAPDSEVRCLAVRVDFDQGRGTVRALSLDTNLIGLTGAGAVNLADETLALRVQPSASLIGIGVSVTLDVIGPIASPRVGTNVLGTAGDLGKTAGLAITGPVALALGAVGWDRAPLGAGQTCAAMLPLARGGRAGAMPAVAAAQPQDKAKGVAPKVNDFLQRLIPR